MTEQPMLNFLGLCSQEDSPHHTGYAAWRDNNGMFSLDEVAVPALKLLSLLLFTASFVICDPSVSALAPLLLPLLSFWFL